MDHRIFVWQGEELPYSGNRRRGSKSVPESMQHSKLWITINTHGMGSYCWFACLSSRNSVHIQVWDSGHLPWSWSWYPKQNWTWESTFLSLRCSMGPWQYFCPAERTKSKNKTGATNQTSGYSEPSRHWDASFQSRWIGKHYPWIISTPPCAILCDPFEVRSYHCCWRFFGPLKNELFMLWCASIYRKCTFPFSLSSILQCHNN